MLAHPKRALFAFFMGLIALMMMVDFLTLNGQTSDSAEIRRKFRQVIQLFETGQKAEAGRLLDEVLQKLVQNPDKELILELKEEAGFKMFIEAMSTKPSGRADEDEKIAIQRLVKGAERFLKLASIEEKRQKTNLGRIRRLVNKMITARHEERYYYMEVISAKVGQYVFTLPELPGILGDSSNRLQIPMIILLTRMGEHSVRPLIEILYSNDGLVRQNAAAILGNIRDRRAIPVLARLAEKDRESRVRETAKQALEKILGKITPLPAKEYFLALAEKFYENDSVFTRNSYQDYVIWKWEKGSLKNWEVPSLLFNEVLAEEALFDALDMDTNYDEAWTLLLNVYFAQINEVMSSLRVAQDLADKERLSETGRTKLDTLQNAARALKMVNVVTSLRGKVQLYRALKRALKDKRAEVAMSCIEALRDLKVDGSLLPRGMASSTPNSGNTGGNVRKVKTDTPAPASTSSAEGSPLLDSLTYDDKRVRYSAAEALARLNPADDFSGSEKVVEVLSEAISEIAPRTVLVIASSPQVRNVMRGYLTSLNFAPFVVATGKSGLHRALSIPTWDLIMISDYLPDLRGYEIIDRLKRDYRTKHIPVFILAKSRLKPKAEIDYQGRASRVIDISSTQNSLKDVLGNLFDTEEYRRDVKGRTVLMAKKAAEALANIPVRSTKLQPQKALQALIGTLTKQPPEVKIPAMMALANLQDPNALKDLTTVFRNKNNEEKVRIAACYAMGEILKTMSDINQEAFVALKVALQESSYNINLAASQAYGKVPLTPEKYLELFNIRAEGEGNYLFRHIVRLRRR